RDRRRVLAVGGADRDGAAAHRAAAEAGPADAAVGVVRAVGGNADAPAEPSGGSPCASLRSASLKERQAQRRRRSRAEPHASRPIRRGAEAAENLKAAQRTHSPVALRAAGSDGDRRKRKPELQWLSFPGIARHFLRPAGG